MHKYLDAASFVLLIVILLFTAFALYGSHQLPTQIPTHFDSLGIADTWTTRSSYELLPFLAVIVYLGLTVVAAFSWLAKHKAEIDTEGVPGVEVVILKLISWVKLELIAAFTYIQISSIQEVRHQQSGILVARLVDTACGSHGNDCVAANKDATSGPRNRRVGNSREESPQDRAGLIDGLIQGLIQPPAKTARDCLKATASRRWLSLDRPDRRTGLPVCCHTWKRVARWGRTQKKSASLACPSMPCGYGSSQMSISKSALESMLLRSRSRFRFLQQEKCLPSVNTGTLRKEVLAF